MTQVRKRTGIQAEAVGSPVSGHLVLVPGLGVASYLRPAALAAAADGWRSWLMRPPGWPGNLRDADPRCSIADVGARLAEWIVAGDRPVVLVGQSIGTQVAAHAAALAPECVPALQHQPAQS
jgi:pimeloyl-ACP methyl ester carboxylesterase